MPRLFPSFRRSRENSREEFAHHEPPHYPQQHHETQARTQNPAWRKAMPSLKPRGSVQQHWDEEVVEHPEPYAGFTGRDYFPSISRHHYHSEDEYDRHSQSTITPTEETYGERYSHDNAVPIVQRESSLSRLQEMFAEHGGATRPVTELNLPQQTTPRHSTVPTVRSHVPSMAEIRNVYPNQRTPVLVQNTTTGASVKADVIRSRGHGHRAPESRSERRREDFRIIPSTSSRSGDSEDERTESRSRRSYPPCVVVVERGRKGKQDTYYVIPGGAPVIFEDEQGNELTRVGDFSGKYRPQRQRPVIIEDERGNEIGRLGFGDESSLDHRSRNSSDDSLYERGRDGYPSYRSRGARTSDIYDEQGYLRRDIQPSHRRPTPSSSPNVVYIDPRSKPVDPRSSSRTSRTSGKSSTSRQQYEPAPRSYNNPNVIHLDRYGRQKSGSISSVSSGRSYPSTNLR